MRLVLLLWVALRSPGIDLQPNYAQLKDCRRVLLFHPKDLAAAWFLASFIKLLAFCMDSMALLTPDANAPVPGPEVYSTIVKRDEKNWVKCCAFPDLCCRPSPHRSATARSKCWPTRGQGAHTSKSAHSKSLSTEPSPQESLWGLFPMPQDQDPDCPDR